jgi:hypothetical protein
VRHSRNTGKRRKQQHPPSDNTVFEMLIRANKKLKRPTARLLWLLWALSDKYGYVSISEPNMAVLLNTNLRQIQESLHTICDVWKYFRRQKAIGVHRPRQYHRNKNPGESDLDFKCRMQADKRVDTVIRLYWVACDLSAADGKATFASSGFNVDMSTMTRARQTMRECGRFAVKSDDKRGTAASYTRIRPSEIERMRMEELIALVRDKAPYKHKVTVANEREEDMRERVQERQLDKVAARALRELEDDERAKQADQQHQARYRFEMENEFYQGPGITAKRIAKMTKKKVIRLEGPWINIDRIRAARIKKFGQDGDDGGAS